MGETSEAEVRRLATVYNRGGKFTITEERAVRQIIQKPALKELFVSSIERTYTLKAEERSRMEQLWLATEEATQFRKELGKHIKDSEQIEEALNIIATQGARALASNTTIALGVSKTVALYLSGPTADLKELLQFGEVVANFDKEGQP